MIKEQAPKISTGQVEHIAKLARIELTEKEKGKFSNELSSILNYVDKLNKVDTKNIKPIQQITGLESITRNDEAEKRNSETRNKILEQAPDKKDNYFKVPKILE
ncbi:Asp-tRNA(Asn)/Glu-tRNA(Gln) amidotransferase subunit GatC [Patescibacteria group bacterium]|nr:Asp-tRNA(Asn)/Glu-tRNA(Gln) amidotransferase subunit GatC [Patescibacteria group bacterium]MBU4458486.1 Asp-tRNA(Asn)/Glu-tRNA(Gln) amidotransferase subunit GatC [Patescibacteria group bacterium]MCG2696339.1 Asp-tRNA(Asn)/Glu-tRNA(Gln) amidotransferase subunit GatC [Candidatus Portnoybacteria bacterium]